MNKTMHNKLVRDLIPEIIERDGKQGIYRKINGFELNKALVDKLSEEGEELLQEVNMEELADLLEIVHALIDLNNFEFEDVETIRKLKQEQRGAFSQGIFLEYVID